MDKRGKNKKKAEVIFILHSGLIVCSLFYNVHINLLMNFSLYMDNYGVSILSQFIISRSLLLFYLTLNVTPKPLKIFTIPIMSS